MTTDKTLEQLGIDDKKRLCGNRALFPYCPHRFIVTRTDLEPLTIKIRTCLATPCQREIEIRLDAIGRRTGPSYTEEREACGQSDTDGILREAMIKSKGESL